MLTGFEVALIIFMIISILILSVAIAKSIKTNYSEGLAIFIKITNSDDSNSRKFFNFVRLTSALNDLLTTKTNIKFIKTVGCDRIILYVQGRSSFLKTTDHFLEAKKLTDEFEKLVAKDFQGIEYTIGCAFGQIMLAKLDDLNVDIFCDSVNCAARMAYLNGEQIDSKIRICFAKKDSVNSRLESVKKINIKGKGEKIVYKFINEKNVENSFSKWRSTSELLYACVPACRVPTRSTHGQAKFTVLVN